MDKDNKYYSLIERLVKAHKKFPGYEAIIEDIIDDVYSHSEVIINSIDNDDVIHSYLEKVISTSIITVPKKLNFNTSVSHRVISNTPVVNNPLPVVEPILTDVAEPEVKIESEIITENNEIEVNEPESANDIMVLSENLSSEKANPKFVDQMINTMNSDLIESQEQSSTEAALDVDVDDLVVVDEEEHFSLEEELPVEEQREELLPDSDETLDIIDNNTVSEVAVDEIYSQPELDVSEDEFVLSDQETTEEQDILIDSDDNMLEDAEDAQDAVQNFDEIAIEDNTYESDNNISADESIETENMDLSSVSESEDILPTSDDMEDFNDELLSPEIAEDIDDVSTPDIADENNDKTEFGDDVISLDIGNDIEEDVVVHEEQMINEIVAESDELSASDGLSISDESDVDLVNDELAINEDGIGDFVSDNMIEASDDLSEITSEDVVEEDSLQNDSDELLAFDNDNNDISMEDISMDLPEENLSIEDETFDIQSSMNEADEIGFIQDNSLEAGDDLLEEDEESEDHPIMEFGPTKEKNDLSHKNPDYSVFNYNPEEVQNRIDVVQITEKLLQLNSTKPQSNVLKIYDLRYKQNYTLEKIASELNIATDDVVEVLNEIVELV